MSILVGNAVVPASDQIPLVGRVDELASFAKLAGDPLDPAGRAVVVLGDAGIGKSRLLSAASATLRDDGWVSFDVRADELDRLVPYAGLRHAIVQQLPQLGSDLADLAALATDLVAALDVAPARSTSSVRSVATRFFSALTGARPVLLAFDELVQVDDDTVVLVANLLRHCDAHALVLAGNLRRLDADTPAAVARLLERLDREQRMATVELGPLPDPAVEQLIGSVLGDGHDTAPLIGAVHRLSAGNPLFVIEATLNLSESEPSPDEPEDIEFSADRRRGFLRRVLRVGPAAAALSRAVALLGVVGHARMGLAAELAGLTPEQAATAFDALVARGILRLRERTGYSVSHDIVREALYQEIGPATRWRWHRSAAEHLAGLPSTPAVDLEVADHIRHVAEVGDTQAIAMLTRAAERACDAAPQSSVTWYRTALSVVLPEDPRRPALLARLVRAFLLAGRPAEAVTTGRLALELMPDGDARTRLVVQVVDAMVLAGDMRDAAGLVDAELPRAGASVTLLAKAAHIHMGVGRPTEALERARIVEERLLSLPVRERIVAVGDLMRMRFVQRRVDALPQLCAVLEEATLSSPPPLALAAYAVLAYAQAGTGETRLASAAIGRAQRVLATVGWTLYSNDLATAQVQNAVHLGDWSSALSIIKATAHDLETTGSRMHLGVRRAAEIEIFTHRGEWAAARHAAEQPLSGDAHCDTLQVWARAGFHLLTGDLEAARTGLKRQLERPTSPQWLRALLLSRLAETELEAGRPQLAADLLADPRRLGQEILDHPTYVAVHLAHGRATEDIDELTDTLRVADTHALALQRGQARLALGALDVEPEVNLTEAARIFQTLRAAPWKRRAVAELRARGLPLPRLRTRPDRLLTETEEQVVRLVQQRCTNREIASAVFLSMKTVEAYLSRIFAKTGCANRVELARAFEAGQLQLAD